MTNAEREALRLARALLVHGAPGTPMRRHTETLAAEAVPVVAEYLLMVANAERLRIRRALIAKANSDAGWATWLYDEVMACLKPERSKRHGS